MKYVNHIDFRLFVYPEEDEDVLKGALVSIVHLDLEKEKLVLQKSTAKGFQEKKIRIYTLVLEKNRHCNAFLNLLKEKLGKEQLERLQKEENRIDDDLHFFMRLDLPSLVHEQKWMLTDKGNCIHISMSIAAFPAKKENAYPVVKKLFSTEPL